jgi:hypothetical protein
MSPDTVPIGDLVRLALEAQRRLADLGEEIEDEWSYVNDLDSAWAARLTEVGDRRVGDPAGSDIVAAVDEAVAEIEAIDDPHRAIDWLSTFPQVVLLALGEPG